MPGALRAGFDTYANFENDADDNRGWREKDGKVKVRSMVLNGAGSFIVDAAEAMAREFYDDVSVGKVEGSGHWIAEENPEGFVKEVLGFVEK